MPEDDKREPIEDEELDFSEISEGDGPINMDYYFSTRRKPRTPTWPYLISAVVMALLLAGVLFYQESCGAEISEILFQAK